MREHVTRVAFMSFMTFLLVALPLISACGGDDEEATPKTTLVECKKEGEAIPVIPNPPECCEGLILIPPKSPDIVGITGICTAKCGNGICDSETETDYNCPQDCEESAPIGADYWPTKGWRTSTPEEQGMDSELLAEMLETIEENEYPIDSVTIIRNGHMVLDTTVYPFTADTKHVIHSCTKSIISALVGIAMDKGYIESIHQPVLAFFPGLTFANVDEAKRAMTLKHILTMTTGLDWPETAPSSDSSGQIIGEMIQSSDWVQFVLDRPMAQEPGIEFNYNTGASHLLSAIIQETTGITALEFAEEYLFGPLGISDVDWTSTSQSRTIGGFGLSMLPHDMAKIGYLYLNDGVWNREQVVSSAWVEVSTREHIRSDLWEGYGYQWWTNDSGFYMALGAEGQCIAVVPDKNMVVVCTSEGAYGEAVWVLLLLNFIIPAAKSSSPLPANPEGIALIESQVAALTEPSDMAELIEISETGITWVYDVTYGSEDTVWTVTVKGGETVDGMECYVSNTSFDAQPQRDVYVAQMGMDFDLIFTSESSWRSRSTLQPLKSEVVLSLVGMALSISTTTEYSYDGQCGAPFSAGKTWVYRELSTPSMGTPMLRTWTAEVVGTEEISVPAGTFNCYRVVHTSGDDTRIEWWSVDRDLLTPVKLVNESAWNAPEIRELVSYDLPPS